MQRRETEGGKTGHAKRLGKRGLLPRLDVPFQCVEMELDRGHQPAEPIVKIGSDPLPLDLLPFQQGIQAPQFLLLHEFHDPLRIESLKVSAPLDWRSGPRYVFQQPRVR